MISHGLGELRMYIVTQLLSIFSYDRLEGYFT
jgi:hypothetical protein